MDKKKNNIIACTYFYRFGIKRGNRYLVKWVTHSHWCGWEGRCHSPVLPSADLEEPYFRPLTYWRGPVWVNANWMIWLGLLKYGYRQIADQIKNGILELAATHGFREYYMLILVKD